MVTADDSDSESPSPRVSTTVVSSRVLGVESVSMLVDLIRDVARRHDLIFGLGEIAVRGAAVPGVRSVAVLLPDELGTLQIAALSDHEVAPTALLARLRLDPSIVAAVAQRQSLLITAPDTDVSDLGYAGVGVVPVPAPATIAAGLLVLLDDELDDAARNALEVLAELVSIVIHQGDPLPDGEARARTMRRALDERNTIEQAKGMLAERFDITPAVAWVRLQRRAEALGIGVAEAATAVVERRDDALGDTRD